MSDKPEIVFLFGGPAYSFAEKVPPGDPLYDAPLVVEHRPRECARRLMRLDGGNVVRWSVQLGDGRWHPHGPLMMVVPGKVEPRDD